MNRPDKRRAKFDRIGTVRSASGHMAIPGEGDRQMMAPFVTLTGEVHRIHADFLLPHVVHAPTPVLAPWPRAYKATGRQAECIICQLLIRRIRATSMASIDSGA